MKALEKSLGLSADLRFLYPLQRSDSTAGLVNASHRYFRIKEIV
ncbi:hypothetical protein HOLDEFILI_02975 [Holdemania filiformis DSM 12042]|uniref:Uncharacterized protein n=1 Tax=Holdemania filiformis DSM 12042 TaxID=545696 RepID=B9YAW8_9FIRM|nr:hypothetical protein HOLDEFILI_02975 [Holdemania filiformis DSM 12042]